MPPNSTQNLNAKLSVPRDFYRAHGESGIRRETPAIQSSAPPVRVFSGPARYQGGYRVNV